MYKSSLACVIFLLMVTSSLFLFSCKDDKIVREDILLVDSVDDYGPGVPPTANSITGKFSPIGNWRLTRMSHINNVDHVTKVIYDSQKKHAYAHLFLHQDSTVYIESEGMIIPSAEPGWHFGDTLQGHWSYGESHMIINIGHPFYYKILKGTSDSLILGECNEDF